MLRFPFYRCEMDQRRATRLNTDSRPGWPQRPSHCVTCLKNHRCGRIQTSQNALPQFARPHRQVPWTLPSGFRAAGQTLESSPRRSHLGDPVLTQQQPVASSSPSGRSRGAITAGTRGRKDSSETQANRVSLGPLLVPRRGNTCPASASGARLGQTPPLGGQSDHVTAYIPRSPPSPSPREAAGSP